MCLVSRFYHLFPDTVYIWLNLTKYKRFQKIEGKSIWISSIANFCVPKYVNEWKGTYVKLCKCITIQTILYKFRGISPMFAAFDLQINIAGFILNEQFWAKGF